MPIAIAGMHRSGTSLVARLLQAAGVDLGPDSELVGPDEHNADGYLENRRFVALNDAILQRLQGGWDAPPSFVDGWEDSSALEPLYEAASKIVRDLALAEPWGWKDPRTSLTLPFWRRSLADVRVVICLRNPLEVLLSLQHRGLTSPAHGLHLWEQYNRDVLAAAPAAERVITCYRRYLHDPGDELLRVAGVLGLTLDEPRVESAAHAVKSELRHYELVDDFAHVGLPDRVVELYGRMLEEATGGAAVPEHVVRAASPPAAEEDLGRLAYVLAAVQRGAGYRRDRDAWQRESERHTREAAQVRRELQAVRERAARAQIREHALEAEVGLLRGEIARQAVELRERAAAADGAHAELFAAKERHRSAVGDAERLATEGMALRARVEGLRADRDAARASEAGALGRLETATTAFELRREELEAARKQAVKRQERLSSEREAARVEGAAATAEAERLRSELAALRAELADAREALDAASAEKAAAVAEVGALQAAVESRDRQLEDAAGERSRIELELDAAGRALEASAAEEDRLRGELDVLADRLMRALAEPRRRDARRLRAPRTAGRRWRWKSLTQLASWIVRPTPRRLGYLRRYFALRASDSFDRRWYEARYPDVAASGLNPLLHYVEHGEREGRDPVPRLAGLRAAVAGVSDESTTAIAAAPEAEAPTGDGRAAVTRPTLEAELATIERSSLFDHDFYCTAYPDVLNAGGRPVEHFCSAGWKEGRNPNPYFDTAWYLRSNPDVAGAGVNPLWHYIVTGEARKPSSHFDPEFYARRYGLGGATQGALADYLAHTRTGDWRSPVELFDVEYYLAENDDVCASAKDPFMHYLRTGHVEGRDPSPRFSTASYRAMYLQGRQDVNPLVHYYESQESGGLQTVAPLEGHVTDQIRRWVAPGEEFEELDPTLSAGEPAAKAIAFYLPQFHAIPENDEWWGAGFTEWRNVMRGAPRFVGHHQPRVPRDLGFYDLSDPRTLPKQVELARTAGLYGFAFYYYWFNGTRLLEGPLEQYLEDSSLDFPFCLMWANENWTRRWDGKEGDVLIRQEYKREDDRALVDDFQRHFADPRYIRLEGRPLLLLYRLDTVPDAAKVVRRWRRQWRARHGEEPLLFLAQCFGTHDPRDFGLDGAVEFPPHKLVEGLPSINTELSVLDPAFSGHVFDYEEVVDRALTEPYPDYPLARTAVPAWDNDARRQGAGLTLHRASPSRYERWLRGLVEVARSHPVFGEPLVFVNAWNEWAEAAYLEPDVHYGGAYLNATARALCAPAPKVEVDSGKRKLLFVGHDAHPHGAQINVWHMGDTMRNQFGCEVAYLLRSGGPMVPRYEELGRVCVTDDDPERTESFLRELRASGYELAITNTAVSGMVVPELKSAGFRVVSLIHELSGIIRQYRLAPALERIMRGSDAVVAPAEIVADAIRPYGSEADLAKIVIRPQGLYQEILAAVKARRDVRRRLGVAGEARIVLNVGFGDDRKGLDIFLRVARLAFERAPELEFVWVGNLHQDYERRLEAEAADGPPGRIHFVPYTEGVADYFGAADVFFLSSREDPFPAVVLEALSVGLPVVAFHGSSGTEALVECHGALVDRDDDDAILGALAELAQADDPERREARRAVVAEEFRFDDYCFALLRLLDPDVKKVSVVVPNFNYSTYLSERLGSIFDQTYPIFEVLVLDDCSTDTSVEELHRLQAETGRTFRVVVNDVNSGSPFKQWAEGCRMARGDYVWIAEADDTSRPTFLERVLCGLDDDGAVYAFSDSAQIDEQGLPLGASYKHYCSGAAGQTMDDDFVLDGPDFVRRCLVERNLILNVSSVVWERSRLERALAGHLGKLNSFRLAGDWYLYTAAALEGGTIGYVAEPLNVHRRHSGSVTGALEKKRHLAEVRRVHRAIEKWMGADTETRTRMDAYEAELAEMFGLVTPGARESG